MQSREKSNIINLKKDFPVGNYIQTNVVLVGAKTRTRTNLLWRSLRYGRKTFRIFIIYEMSAGGF